jgi:hypothetical protein
MHSRLSASTPVYGLVSARDGSHREVVGLTVTEYLGGGQVSFQGSYNWEEVVPVLKEWAAAR